MRTRRLIAAPVLAVALMAAPAIAGANAPEPRSQNAGSLEARSQALMARAEDFAQRMGREMGEAAAAAGQDDARLQADLDVIQLRYQPEANAVAAEMEAIEASRISTLPPSEQVAQWASLNASVARLRNAPAFVRAGVTDAMSSRSQ